MPTKKSSSGQAANNDNAPKRDAENVTRALYNIIEDEDPNAPPPGTASGEALRVDSAPGASLLPNAQPQSPQATAASRLDAGMDPFVKAFLCGGAFALGTFVFGPIGGKAAAILTGILIGGGGHHPQSHNITDGTFS